MDKRIEKCEYCVEYNGDCVEEADGFDYYSCELKKQRRFRKIWKILVI